MKRLLITGASGLLGANLVLKAMGAYEVIAVSRQHAVRQDGCIPVLADLTEEGAARRIVAEYRPEAVVHCAAATDLEACERDPKWAFLQNRDMARWIAEACRAHGAKLVHISTDAVFDGENGPYSELDPPRPISAYGESKLGGERAVLEAYEGAIVARCNFFGWNAQPKSSLGEWFLERLASGKPTSGFTDVWVSPLYAGHLARLVLALVERGEGGLIHLPGADCVSKYHFGRRLARVFGLDPDLVQPASVEDAGLQARRAKRLCLRGAQAETALGVKLPSLEEGLRAFRRHGEDGYRQRLRALVGRE